MSHQPDEDAASTASVICVSALVVTSPFWAAAAEGCGAVVAGCAGGCGLTGFEGAKLPGLKDEAVGLNAKVEAFGLRPSLGAGVLLGCGAEVLDGGTSAWSSQESAINITCPTSCSDLQAISHTQGFDQ